MRKCDMHTDIQGIDCEFGTVNNFIVSRVKGHVFDSVLKNDVGHYYC